MKEKEQSSAEMDGLSKEAALLELMEETGYSMLQENGQRKYGPPPGWKGGPPPRGCEVFAGKLPRDIYEDELVPLFSKAGRIYEMRLMMEFSGENRGYAFVTYTTKEAAHRAIQLLDNHEIRPGKTIGVCTSLDNCRLFLGSIPRDITKDEILEEMSKVTEGVVDVIVYPSASDTSKHRGFAFIEYNSHKAAAMARRKLIPGAFKLWGHTLQVDWAEPERDVDEETMQRVKVLYVRNLMLDTTEETLRQEFSRLKPGSVERVKKLTDYAFVHFREREDALNALHAMDQADIDGASIQVSLAKPAYKEGADGARSKSFGRGYLGNRRPEGLGGAGGGAFRTEDRDLMLGGVRGDTPRLPRRVQSLPPRLGGAVCYGPTGVGADSERFLFPCLPGTPLSSTSLCCLRPSQLSTAVSLLELYCQKNHWPPPEYQLYSAPGPNNQLCLIYKVSISSVNNSFMPDKLCTLVENAKELAAQNALWSLECSFVSGGGPGAPGSPGGVALSPPPLERHPSALVNSPSHSSSGGGGGGGPGLMMFGGARRPIACLSPAPPLLSPPPPPDSPQLPPGAPRHYNNFPPPQLAFY